MATILPAALTRSTIPNDLEPLEVLHEKEDGYLDLSDLLQINSDSEEAKAIRENLLKAPDRVRKSFASENVAGRICATAVPLINCNGLGLDERH